VLVEAGREGERRSGPGQQGRHVGRRRLAEAPRDPEQPPASVVAQVVQRVVGGDGHPEAHPLVPGVAAQKVSRKAWILARSRAHCSSFTSRSSRSSRAARMP
jgi:hypothetical protein